MLNVNMKNLFWAGVIFMFAFGGSVMAVNSKNPALNLADPAGQIAHHLFNIGQLFC